ncbi:hypothetical protein [Clostridium magnum]|uniref:Uncharacterized protein n=1 Tax=Clostridium magnum DSM 2767 TaxID=1121326 RepID=A0A161WDS8_9CLOT|nr:hypothetical protein [Clostridium magnum]KZL89845.1 hypothetical protein CLMAG_48550 [Clostridium magnum DSM 2767]SHI70551.1 hypothetical protein SAMN02745944_04719 [Clostridium magnum DSM 2767]
MQRLVNKQLQAKGISAPYVDYLPIFVIANDVVEIDNHSNELTILRTSSIYPYIANKRVIISFLK